MNLRRRFGERLREEREGKGLTQSELGPQPYVSAVENGHKRITLDQAEDFAALLKMDVVDLFRERSR